MKLLCLLLLLCSGCVNKVEDHKKPRPIRRTEIIAHPSANGGVPMVLHWCFVQTPKANSVVQSLTPSQFFQTKEEVMRSFPQEITFKKTMVMPGQNSVIELPKHSVQNSIYLYARFANQGMKRWVVLPRGRIRLEIQHSDIQITTREDATKKKPKKRLLPVKS